MVGALPNSCKGESGLWSDVNCIFQGDTHTPHFKELAHVIVEVWPVQNLQGRLQVGNPGKTCSSNLKVVCWHNPSSSRQVSLCSVKTFN